MNLKLSLFLLVPLLALRAEVRTMSLRAAVDRALRQNPEIAMARLEEQKAKHAVRLARDPFTPRVTVGSGLAYSSGFPLSIEGAAPAIFRADATASLFNRPQSYAVAQAKERENASSIATSSKRDEIAFRTTSLMLDAERAARLAEMARRQLESLEKVTRAVEAQIGEGRLLPVEAKRAALNLAVARQMLLDSEAEQETAETTLALVLGYGAEDRVRPAAEPRPAPALPESEEAAIEDALVRNPDLRGLQSQVAVKELEIRGAKAQRLPRIDLVAQYALLSRFNNYEEFFNKFQRNNGQIGMSFQLPILPGPGVGAAVGQSEAEIARLRLEVNQLRNRIIAGTRQNFRDVRKTEAAAETARLDLELAREQLSILLAQMQEGRAGLRQVEEARVAETNKWMSFYDAQLGVERAKWNLLRQTGDLVAALR